MLKNYFKNKGLTIKLFHYLLWKSYLRSNYLLVLVKVYTMNLKLRLSIRKMNIQDSI